MIIIYLISLAILFYMLMKVCDDYFVDSLDKISARLKLSSEAAGATLMAMGSSAPELFVSLIALLKPGDHGSMGAGTIVGSAIFNILAIIGASLVIRKAHILWQPVVRDIAFYSVSILLLLLFFMDGVVTLSEAIILIGVYIVYVVAVVNWKKLLKYEEKKFDKDQEEDKKEDKGLLSKVTYIFDFVLNKTFPSKKKFYLNFILSLVWITILSWLLVESGVGLAHVLNVPEVIIGLTILAFGTSIPDLISSLIVAKEGRADMAISNAIGSNIFDILFGLGFPWILTISLFGKNILIDRTNLYSSIILLFATVICIAFLFVMQRWKLEKKSGLFLVMLYIIYLSWLLINAYI